MSNDEIIDAIRSRTKSAEYNDYTLNQFSEIIAEIDDHEDIVSSAIEILSIALENCDEDEEDDWPLNCPYECHKIGGPWIAENPDCPRHGRK